MDPSSSSSTMSASASISAVVGAAAPPPVSVFAENMRQKTEAEVAQLAATDPTNQGKRRDQMYFGGYVIVHVPHTSFEPALDVDKLYSVTVAGGVQADVHGTVRVSVMARLISISRRFVCRAGGDNIYILQLTQGPSALFEMRLGQDNRGVEWDEMTWNDARWRNLHELGTPFCPISNWCDGVTLHYVVEGAIEEYCNARVMRSNMMPAILIPGNVAMI